MTLDKPRSKSRFSATCKQQLTLELSKCKKKINNDTSIQQKRKKYIILAKWNQSLCSEFCKLADFFNLVTVYQIGWIDNNWTTFGIPRFVYKNDLKVKFKVMAQSQICRSKNNVISTKKNLLTIQSQTIKRKLN